MAKKPKKSEPKPSKTPKKKIAPEKEAASKPKSTSQKKKRVQMTPEAKSAAYLTPTELEYFRQLLLTKRGELIGDLNHMEDETLLKSRLNASGDLSTMPIHMADIGTQNYEQEFALGLLDGERKLLREINDALLRIQDKTYGICEGTGKEIGKLRLEANPWARYCVEYARMVEKGLIKEGEYLEDDEDEDDDILDDNVDHIEDDDLHEDVFTEEDEIDDDELEDEEEEEEEEEDDLDEEWDEKDA